METKDLLTGAAAVVVVIVVGVFVWRINGNHLEDPPADKPWKRLDEREYESPPVYQPKPKPTPYYDVPGRAMTPSIRPMETAVYVGEKEEAPTRVEPKPLLKPKPEPEPKPKPKTSNVKSRSPATRAKLRLQEARRSSLNGPE